MTSSQHSLSGTEAARQCKTTALRKLSHMDFHKMSKEKVKKALEKLTENSRKKLRLDGDKGEAKSHSLSGGGVSCFQQVFMLHCCA